MLVILLIAILIGLLAPMLAQTRDRAKIVASLANLRSNAGLFTTYATNWKDAWPAFTQAELTFTVIRPPCEPGGVPLLYFFATTAWNVALAEDEFGLSCNAGSFYSPLRSKASGLGRYSDYHFSCTLLAEPGWWNMKTRTGVSQLRGTRAGDVLFPSAKVLMVDAAVAERSSNTRGTAPHAVAMVDGSAAASPLRTFLPGLPSGDMGPTGVPHLLGLHNFDWLLGMHTIDGVRGRDRR